jgi:hypothetical protein
MYELVSLSVDLTFWAIVGWSAYYIYLSARRSRATRSWSTCGRKCQITIAEVDTSMIESVPTTTSASELAAIPSPIVRNASPTFQPVVSHSSRLARR